MEFDKDHRTPLLEKSSNLNLRNIQLDINQKEFIIAQYDEMCEDFSKIDKIVCLRLSKIKIVFYILLNILTLCIINLFLLWFPSLRLIFLYSKCKLSEAKYVGIYGSDSYFYVESISVVELPDIEGSVLIKHCRDNIYNQRSVLMFQFKYYDYVYDPKMENFASVDFLLKCTHDKVHNNFSKGLTINEYTYQKQLFKNGDIDLKTASSMSFLFSSLTNPFYFYTEACILFWFLNNYAPFAYFMIIVVVTSITLEVYEARNIQKNIMNMSNYSLKIKVFRRKTHSDNDNYTTAKVKKEKEIKLFYQSLSDFEEISSNDLVPGDLIQIPKEGGRGVRAK